MSATQHTPGPWIIRDNCINGAPETHPVSPGRGFVATVGFHTDAKKRLLSDRQKANLLLIASAPDLLAALYFSEIALRSCLHSNVQVDAAFEQVRKAIDRATGSGFVDYRTPEEMAASYPRVSVWSEGEGSK